MEVCETIQGSMFVPFGIDLLVKVYKNLLTTITGLPRVEACVLVLPRVLVVFSHVVLVAHVLVFLQACWVCW